MKLFILAILIVAIAGCATSNQNYCHSIPECVLSISDQIGKNINSQHPRRVLVEIQIDNNKNVENVAVVESSGDKLYDAMTTDAVKKSSPFTQLNGLETGTFNKNFRVFRVLLNPIDSDYDLAPGTKLIYSN